MSALTKPFAALWRARGYVIAGVAIYLLSLVPLPYKDVDPNVLEWWQVILGKAFGSLDKVAYALLLAGLVYAVASDLFDLIWSSKLGDEFNQAVSKIGGIVQAGLGDFVAGLGSMSFEAVKVWIEKGQAESSQLRVVGASSLKTHFGQHLAAPGNFLDFVLESVVDVSARMDAQTWDRFTSTIAIRQGRIPDHFQWEERRTYSIVCHALGCSVPIRIENSWQIGSAHVQAALADLEFNMEVDGQRVIGLKAWLQRHSSKLQGREFDISADDIRCSYNGVWLKFSVASKFSPRGQSARVAIYERSHISQQDRCHALFLRHPTKGVQLSIRLEGLSGWVVKQPVASAQAYSHGENVVDVSQPHLESASVEMMGWTLPGLAVVTEWTPV